MEHRTRVISPRNERRSKGLTGIAGEYYVAAELSRRGFIATITLRNTEGIDIMASRPDQCEMYFIQVKTNQTQSPRWILSKQSEKSPPGKYFYVFVSLKGDRDRPDFFIVPGTIVAKQIKKDHQRWLSAPGRDGSLHKDGSMRTFITKGDEYLDKWELLK